MYASSDVDALIIPINRAGQELLKNNVGREITNYDIFTLASQAYIIALTPSNIINAFKKTGIVLLDFSLTVKAVPSECVIRTSQPKA